MQIESVLRLFDSRILFLVGGSIYDIKNVRFKKRSDCAGLGANANGNSSSIPNYKSFDFSRCIVLTIYLDQLRYTCDTHVSKKIFHNRRIIIKIVNPIICWMGACCTAGSDELNTCILDTVFCTWLQHVLSISCRNCLKEQQ